MLRTPQSFGSVLNIIVYRCKTSVVVFWNEAGADSRVKRGLFHSRSKSKREQNFKKKSVRGGGGTISNFVEKKVFFVSVYKKLRSQHIGY